MTMTTEQRRAVRGVADALLSAVRAAGEHGAPGGVLYAASMGVLSLQTFQRFMDALVETGQVRRRGHLYFCDNREENES